MFEECKYNPIGYQKFVEMGTEIQNGPKNFYRRLTRREYKN